MTDVCLEIWRLVVIVAGLHFSLSRDVCRLCWCCGARFQRPLKMRMNDLQRGGILLQQFSHYPSVVSARSRGHGTSVSAILVDGSHWQLRMSHASLLTFTYLNIVMIVSGWVATIFRVSSGEENTFSIVVFRVLSFASSSVLVLLPWLFEPSRVAILSKSLTMQYTRMNVQPSSLPLHADRTHSRRWYSAANFAIFSWISSSILRCQQECVDLMFYMLIIF